LAGDADTGFCLEGYLSVLFAAGLAGGIGCRSADRQASARLQ
jgi:hypothetical protein